MTNTDNVRMNIIDMIKEEGYEFDTFSALVVRNGGQDWSNALDAPSKTWQPSEVS